MRSLHESPASCAGSAGSASSRGALHPSPPDAVTHRIRWKRLDLDQFFITSTLIEPVAAAATWSQSELTSDTRWVLSALTVALLWDRCQEMESRNLIFRGGESLRILPAERRVVTPLWCGNHWCPGSPYARGTTVGVAARRAASSQRGSTRVVCQQERSSSQSRPPWPGSLVDDLPGTGDYFNVSTDAVSGNSLQAQGHRRSRFIVLDGRVQEAEVSKPRVVHSARGESGSAKSLREKRFVFARHAAEKNIISSNSCFQLHIRDFCSC